MNTSFKPEASNPSSSNPQLAKAATGIEGLDDILLGGIPQGRPTLVCGAAGCGKTLHARALMEFFNCRAMHDDWRPSAGLNPGILHLTNMQPGGPALPYSDGDMEAYTFEHAMRLMTTAHAKLLAAP